MNNRRKTLYDILGVQRHASLLEIRKAYKKLASKYHPDKNEGSLQSKAEFQNVSEAYQVLKDAAKRQKYDDTGQVELSSSGKEKQAEQMVLGIFQGLLESDAIARISSDVIKVMSGNIRSAMAQNQDLMSQLKSKMASATKLSKEITLKTGDEDDNLLKIAADSHVKQMFARIKGIKQGLEVQQMALTLLEGYEHSPDGLTQLAVGFGAGTSSTYTTNTF